MQGIPAHSVVLKELEEGGWLGPGGFSSGKDQECWQQCSASKEAAAAAFAAVPLSALPHNYIPAELNDGREGITEEDMASKAASDAGLGWFYLPQKNKQRLRQRKQRNRVLQASAEPREPKPRRRGIRPAQSPPPLTSE